MTAAEYVATVHTDPLLPHQVRIKGDLTTGTLMLTVTCSCLIKADGSYTALIEPRRHLGARELLAAFREHEEKVSGS